MRRYCSKAIKQVKGLYCLAVDGDAEPALVKPRVLDSHGKPSSRETPFSRPPERDHVAGLCRTIESLRTVADI